MSTYKLNPSWVCHRLVDELVFFDNETLLQRGMTGTDVYIARGAIAVWLWDALSQGHSTEQILATCGGERQRNWVQESLTLLIGAGILLAQDSSPAAKTLSACPDINLESHSHDTPGATAASIEKRRLEDLLGDVLKVSGGLEPGIEGYGWGGSAAAAATT